MATFESSFALKEVTAVSHLESNDIPYDALEVVHGEEDVPCCMSENGTETSDAVAKKVKKIVDLAALGLDVPISYDIHGPLTEPISETVVD